MKYLKKIVLVMVAAGSVLVSRIGDAQTTQQADLVKTETKYAEGEVKRVDSSLGKITIKHGAIKNLDMPPMTMVFTVKEKSMLNDIATGDQVRFIVVSENGKMVITELVK